MSPLLLAIMAASAAGGALSNRKKTTTNDSKYNNTSTSSVTELPGAIDLRTQLADMIRKRMSSGSAVPVGYREGGIRDINSTFDVLNQNREGNSVRRGLTDSPMTAFREEASTNARGGEIGRFLSGIPLVERNLENENMGMASSIYSLFPRSTTQTSSGTGQQKHTDPGNMLGGGLSGLSQMMAFMMGNGLFGGGGGRPPSRLPFGSGSLGNMNFGPY